METGSRLVTREDLDCLELRDWRARKGQLLEHYCQREPKQFIQFDGFAGHPEDSVMRHDDDGHTLWKSVTYELMHGATVRVLVDPGTDAQTAATLMRKLANWIEQDPSDLGCPF